MKYYNFTIQKSIVFACFISLMACSNFANKEDKKALETRESKDSTNQETSYDAVKAKSFGADDYGMKTYVMAFLKSGPNRPTDSTQSSQLMRAHLGNISRLAKEGKLVLAGPFYGDGELRGIYIFNTDNLDSAKSYTASDPAIQYGSLEMELIKWYGSAALMEVNEIHKTLAKSEI